MSKSEVNPTLLTPPIKLAEVAMLLGNPQRRAVRMSVKEIPYWPAAMNLKTSAAYCGLSIDTFKEKYPVKPIQFTQSTHGHRYLRQRLDEWLLSLDPNAVQASSMGDIFSSGVARQRRFGDRL
jgi:hypothetical protein